HHGNVLGYVAIDSTVGGRSCGGLRMLPDIEKAEIQALARSMTLKYGFLGLPQGGAKAGVFGDPDSSRQKRLERLVEFGLAIKPLLQTKAYIPYSDMGTQNSDIRHMLNVVGIPVRSRDLQNNTSGYYTAISVSKGVLEAARHIGLNLSGCTAAVEGFGSVGSSLAGLLAGEGIKVIAISTSRGALYNPSGLDVVQLLRLAEEVGSRVVEVYPEAERIDREKLLELPVDILCPCARWNSLTMSNVPRISARVISPGANNPITPDAELALFEREVLCLPDFVTNCGGVLGGTMEFASVSREKITAFINHHIGVRIAWLLNEAKSKHQLPREVAVPFALRRFNQVAQSAKHPTPLNRLFNLGLEFYRHGWIPGRLVAPLSLRYFEKLLT
ncbi:MAG: Glu/Leu/Phe/Val dehydrogenase dimerization domain-containing protein, partial [Thermodesulfobacteriota bacterium]